MKEILELRVNLEYAHLLFDESECKNVGSSIVKIVYIAKDDPRYNKIPLMDNEIKRKYDTCFFYGWKYKRSYTQTELNSAKLLQMKIDKVFEPTGEECGTLYDESVACKICGAKRKQISSLILKKKSIPQKDIAKTIGGEIVVSSRFAEAVKRRSLKGLNLLPVNFVNGESSYYQLKALNGICLSNNTVVGVNPFDLSTYCREEIYKCPNGDTIGLNLLSEAYVVNNHLIYDYDFLESKQYVGINRGLLRPEPIYFCSQSFRQMVKEEKLSGFEFEIANIE